MVTYLTPNTIVEIVCFLSAVVCLRRDSDFVWRSMIVYLLITCVAEISGIYIAEKTHNNNWIYNLFLICEAGFTNLMFAHLFNRRRKAKTLVVMGCVLFGVLYICGLFDHGFFVYNNATYTVMSILYFLYGLYYYYYLLTDHRYIDLKRSSEFWWVAGTLFFYFSNTACNLFDQKLEGVMITAHMTLNYLIFAILNIILYGCWSYSFICRKWETKRSET